MYYEGRTKCLESYFDCLGRLACKGNPDTGLVECLYKGNKTSALLAVGDSFTVERQGVETTITRVSQYDFNVKSKKKAPEMTI